MRRICALLVGIALLSSGCTTGPTVMGISGNDWVPLSTREQVNEALGVPSRSATVNGVLFEEFLVRNGCDQNVLGYHVAAFQPLEEFHIQGWADLLLVSVKDVGSIPRVGKNLIVVASVEKSLYLRIFDDGGNTVVDTDESRLPTKSRQIADLKQFIERVGPPHTPTVEEKQAAITAVVAVIGHSPLGSFELGVGNMETYGLIHIGTLPTDHDPSRVRAIPGQTIRFDYDNSDNVTKVYLDGQVILSPGKKSLTSSTSSMQH
jgi:hypothetical protein